MVQLLKKWIGFLYNHYSKYMKRIRRRAIYRKMAPFLERELNHIFEGKRVAIVGPADSAMLEKKGSYINSFDFIIRLNKGYQLLGDDENIPYIGNRTDVLFSRLDNREAIEKSTYDYELLSKQKIKYIIGFWRTEQFGAYHRILSFIKEYSSLYADKIKIIRQEKYVEIMKSIGFAKPSVGYIALFSVLECNPKQLYLTGITFYLTEYQKGYRDHTNTEKQLAKFRQREDGHDPEKERIAFLELYQKHKHQIELDTFLDEHIASIQLKQTNENSK